MYQQRALREARVLDSLGSAVPLSIKRAQAHRVFEALRAMLSDQPPAAGPPARRH